MAAELTYRPGYAPGLDHYHRILCYRVDDMTYLVQDRTSQPPHESIFLATERDGVEHGFTHIPYDDAAFVWVARQQMTDSSDGVFVMVSGERQPVRMDLLREIDTAKMVGPVWCPVANMTAQRPYGPGGAETKRGSKHFAAGAKLYYLSGFWGTAAEQVEVMGHHRGSRRYVTMIVSSAGLENWRVELVYSPHVIRALWPKWSGTARAKIEEAQDIVASFSQRAAESSSAT